MLLGIVCMAINSTFPKALRVTSHDRQTARRGNKGTEKEEIAFPQGRPVGKLKTAARAPDCALDNTVSNPSNFFSFVLSFNTHPLKNTDLKDEGIYKPRGQDRHVVILPRQSTACFIKGWDPLMLCLSSCLQLIRHIYPFMQDPCILHKLQDAIGRVCYI